MRKLILTLGLLSLFTGLAHAGSPGAETPKQKDIRKLLMLTGSSELGKQVMTQMIGNMKGMLPNVPEKFWSDFMKDVKTEELIDLIVPIYDRNLSAEDIKALIAFYESPAGRRFVAVLPKITQESMTAGQEWGKALGMKVAARLQQQGLQK